MATSNLGEAIGNSKELTAAAALYDRGQAREDAINAAALARKERADAAQAARDDKKLEEASKWITVNTNAIHPFWQEDAVKASSTFMMKAADEYAKNPAYIRSPKFNQDFNRAMAEIGKLTLNSKAISQDIVAQQVHPDRLTFKPGYADAIASGDRGTFRAYFDKVSPNGTYIQGQGLQENYDMKAGFEKIKQNITPSMTIQPINAPASMQKKGEQWGQAVHFLPASDIEKNAFVEWTNSKVAQMNYPTFDEFKKALPTQGDFIVKTEDAKSTPFAPTTTVQKQYSNVGGLGIGGVGNNGSWVVNRATSLDAAYQLFSPKTNMLADIKIDDIYNLEAISPTSQGQKSIFVKAFDAGTGEPVKGNVVGARVKSVIHVANPEDFRKGSVDKDGYAIIAFGDETKQAEFQKVVDANTGKVDWNLVQSLNMPIYIAPYDDNKLTIQGQTVSPTDPKGFFLKGSGSQTVTNATGSTGGGAKVVTPTPTSSNPFLNAAQKNGRTSTPSAKATVAPKAAHTASNALNVPTVADADIPDTPEVTEKGRYKTIGQYTDESKSFKTTTTKEMISELKAMYKDVSDDVIAVGFDKNGKPIDFEVYVKRGNSTYKKGTIIRVVPKK